MTGGHRGGRLGRDMSEHPIVACTRGLDSADAVGLGALLAGALGEPLVLASAYRYEPISLTARAAGSPANARRAGDAAATLQRARAFAGPDVEVRERVVPADRPGSGIVEALVTLALEVDACALVLGRDTHSHVTRSLVPRAPCPVAVAPLSMPLPRPPLARIGVAYDGSPSAQLALVAARKLARRTAATLALLAAGPTAEHAMTWLHIARLSLGFRVEHELRPLAGDPATILTQASGDVDLLVCGSRGRGRPLSAILGSVSAHLVARAQCPVLVVPPAAWGSELGPLGVTSAAANA